MNVVLVQTDIVWEDKATNFNRVERLVAENGIPAGSLLVLPEMFATGFSMNTGSTAENTDGETTDFLKKLAKSTGSAVIAGLVVEGHGGEALNRALCINRDGETVCTYDKMHPFSFSGEDEHFERGNRIGGFEAGGFRVAPFVCYDLRFPEIYRAASISGAEVLVTIANWPTPRIAHWHALLRARSIENLAFVVGVNRVGTDPKNDYCGGSVVCDPKGEWLLKMGSDEDIGQISLDGQAMMDYRRSFPALEDVGKGFRDWCGKMV